MEAKNTKVTQEVFDKLKLLQNAGVNARQAPKFIPVSNVTAFHVYKSETLEEYEVRIRRTYKRNQPAPETYTPSSLELKQDMILKAQQQTNTLLNTLIEVIKDKEAHANVSWWKR